MLCDVAPGEILRSSKPSAQIWVDVPILDRINPIIEVILKWEGMGFLLCRQTGRSVKIILYDFTHTLSKTGYGSRIVFLPLLWKLFHTDTAIYLQVPFNIRNRIHFTFLFNFNLFCLFIVAPHSNCLKITHDTYEFICFSLIPHSF